MKLILVLFVLFIYSHCSTVIVSTEKNLNNEIRVENHKLYNTDTTWYNLNVSKCNGISIIKNGMVANFESDILTFSNFSFKIPKNSVIVSLNIKILIYTETQQTEGVYENLIGMGFTRNSPTYKLNTTIYRSSYIRNSPVILSYPLTSDSQLWGANLTPSVLNSENFTIFIKFKCGRTDSIVDLRCFSITTTYETIDVITSDLSTSQPQVTTIINKPKDSKKTLAWLVAFVFVIVVILFALGFGYIKNCWEKKNNISDEWIIIREDETELEVLKSMKSANIPTIEPKELFKTTEFSNIYKCVLNSQTIIVKVDKKEPKIYNEYNLLKTLKHPNIVQTFGCMKIYLEDINSSNQYQIGISLEYFDHGTLLELINSSELVMSFKKKVSILCGISSGLCYLKKEKILHRDINTRNVILDFKNDSYVPKIIDFGNSIRLTDSYYEEYTNIGIRKYQAKEVVLEKKYSFSSEVWSFGLLIWELFSSRELMENDIIFEKNNLPVKPPSLNINEINSILDQIFKEKTFRMTIEDCNNALENLK